jgi:hypothetical protein
LPRGILKITLYTNCRVEARIVLLRPSRMELFNAKSTTPNPF